ncbi:hypothetical protein DBR45_23860 [Pseudomonas sp. HMWF031]|nr:hypothetical protein DBR45_23860 [Pseudomonas sp. HMWF031]
METTTLDDGNKRYSVAELVERGSDSKHGVLKIRTEAEAVCSHLTAEHSRKSGISRKSLST